MLKLEDQNCNFKLNTLKPFTLALGFALCILRFSEPAPAMAQTLDSTLWQSGATGLRTTSNAENKTGGLAAIIKASGIPFVSIHGGVYEGGWAKVWVDPDNKRIELGEIKVPGTSPALISQVADWAHNEMIFTNNLKLWVSRLTPAVLIQSQNTSLRLFSGNLNGAYFAPSPWAPYPMQVNNRAPAPAYPKYLAYSLGGAIHVQQIPVSGAPALSLSGLEGNWILIWYGNNSHFVETRTPTAYSQTIMNLSIPDDDAYLADAPILLKFENGPASIRQTTEGGIDLTFSGDSGYSSFMPLLGREHPASSVTENWGISGVLPNDIINRINFWVTGNRLCSYPLTVSETYNYVSSTDTAQITDNITYLNVCAGGSTNQGFAIIPPVLSLSKDSFGNNFNINGGFGKQLLSCGVWANSRY